MRKGSNFEREMCRKFSEWWTYGERDDIFWRSSQSGGRATVRARKGKTTAGSYGDLCALDPIGEPFLRLFTVELKRGRKHGEPGDYLDYSGNPNKHPFLRTLDQARTSHEAAGSKSWLLVCRRDFRRPVCFFPSWLLRGPLLHAKEGLTLRPIFRYRINSYDFAGIRLEEFFDKVDPLVLSRIAESL